MSWRADGKKWAPGRRSTISNMFYVEGFGSQPNFDCDDFAYGFQNWCHVRGYNCWQISIYWKDHGGDASAHVLNIIEIMADPALGAERLCYALFEPQTSVLETTWLQPARHGVGIYEVKPRPSDQIVDEYACSVCGARPGTAWVRRIWGNEHSPGAGEAVFVASGWLRRQFQRRTKVNVAGWTGGGH